MALISKDIDIEEFFSKYIDLKEYKTTVAHLAVTHLIGNCPFCKHENSFMYVKSKKAFYCTACKAGGDIITFLSKHYRLTPNESVKFLSNLKIIDTVKKEIITALSKSTTVSSCKITIDRTQKKDLKKLSAISPIKINYANALVTMIKELFIIIDPSSKDFDSLERDEIKRLISSVYKLLFKKGPGVC